MIRLVAFFLAAVWGLSAWAFDNLDVGVPGKCDQVVEREGYALGYSEAHEQAFWVQYRFTRDENQTRGAIRKDNFRPDPKVKTGSAALADYRGSGYDRGHLAPAADMKWSVEAMNDSFYLSNISPQDHAMNAGVWNDVEKFVRYTVNVEDSIIVVTGPVFKGGEKKIGANGVTVPSAFYKIIYDETEPRKMIAFIVPNRDSYEPLTSFVVSVDEVEAQTGLDFFKKVKGADSLEAKSDISAWKKLNSWRRSTKGDGF